ncbi:MAG TPA: STM4015 family protein [Actinocrinis sp.]|jgi:hypothetical protein
MSFGDYLTEFAGLPVVALPVSDDQPMPQVEPDAVAWRLSVNTESGWKRTTTDWIGEYESCFRALLERVDSTRVVAIVTGMTSYGEYSPRPHIQRLVEHAVSFPNLRAIFHGDLVHQDSDVAYMTQTDPTPLLEAFPGLEALHIRGGFDTWQGHTPFAPFTHAALRTLVFESGGLAPEAIRAVVRSELPELEHLELYFGDEEYGGGAGVEDIAGLLDGDRFPKLRRLGLRDAPNQDEIAAAVALAPVVARLDVLDLSLGALGDEGAAALLAGQPLKHLARLDLHHHYLSDAMMQRLREALDGVQLDLSDQQEPDMWNGVAHRYIAVSE